MYATAGRQQPGLACEECRRRKARCDRRQPRCSSCIESGAACITVTQRPQRGPKKGQVEMLKSRIAMLEWELEHQKEPNSESLGALGSINSAVTIPQPSMTTTENSPFTDFDMISDNFMAYMTGPTTPSLEWPSTAATTPSSEASYTLIPSGVLNRDSSAPSSSTTIEKHLNTGNVSPVTSFGDSEISGLILADLDDAYFDRVQDVCPMVHQRRYFAWASQNNTSPARECLRSAMHTLAAAMSAPYRGLVTVLYNKTCRLLEKFKQVENTELSWCTSQGTLPIEYIQASLLLAHYESLRINEWRAMHTAGYAFRLVQMARLHEIDAPDRTAIQVSSHPEIKSDFATTEEKRRTFWVAYNLDCFLAWRSEWPLTLYEDMVSTRLPAPESNFQNSQPIRTDMLPEALAKDALTFLSPFAECVVLVTLHSRCMAHRRSSFKESSKEPRSSWGRHEWLASAIDRRIQLLAQMSAITTIEREPMLFFTHMLAYCLDGTIQGMSRQAAKHQPTAIPAYEQRVGRAVAEVVRLVKALPSSRYLKAHPFLPNLLASAIAFILTQGPTLYDQAGAEVILRLLRDMRDVNSLAAKICSVYDGTSQSLLLQPNR